MTKQLEKQHSKKEEDTGILGYEKLVRKRAQMDFSERDKAFKKRMHELNDKLSEIDKDLDSEKLEEKKHEEKKRKNLISAHKSRHNKVVQHE